MPEAEKAKEVEAETQAVEEPTETTEEVNAEAEAPAESEADEKAEGEVEEKEAETETEAKVVDGVTIYTPAEGNQCGYDAFPSAPEIFEGVHLLGDEVKDGFCFRDDL